MCISGYGNEIILKKGWYKAAHNGTKVMLKNIEHFDAQSVKTTDYLRVNGRITKLPPGSIRNLPSITTLKLVYCSIQDIQPDAFQNLNNLATMALHDNEIKRIQYGVFNNMNVTVLFLHRNQIESIDSTAFDDMPNLYRIKLNHNNIKQWDNNWFKNTPQLTELLFRRNFLIEIPPEAFKNIKGSHVTGTGIAVDTKIYLSKNQITNIAPNAFQGLTEFSHLWLDRNQLKEIDDKVFSSITQAGAIILSRNLLTNIPKQLFSNLKTELLSLVLIGNNHLTCVPYEVVSKVKMTNLQGIKRLRCDCVREVLKKCENEKKSCDIKTSCDKGGK